MKNSKNKKEGVSVPEIFFVWSDELQDRFDPFFYRPVFKNLLEVIANNKTEKITLKESIVNSVAGDWGEDPIDFEPNPDYELCYVVRNTNFHNDFNLDFSDVAQRYIKKSKAEKLALKKGDILIEKSGGSPIQPVGRVALIDDLPFDKPVVFSNFLQKMEVNKELFLPEYIFVYLQALYKTGYMDFIQNQTTGIKNLRLDDFFKILVIKPSIAEQKKVAQKAIKSREEAKSLLEKAKTILASIDSFVLGELGIEIERERERVSKPAQIWQIWSDAIEKRLDPMFFHPLRLRAIEAIKKSNVSVIPLSEVVKFRRELVNDIPENTPYIGLENIVSNSGEYMETNAKESISSAFVFKKGDVLFPKLRPYLNKVFYADFDGICSTEFHVFEAKKCDPYFLFSFLTRSVVVEQTSRLMTGNTLPRLQTEDIENLLIPIPNQTTQEKIVAGVKTIYNKARNLRQEAETVIAEAQKQTAEMIFA